MRPVIYIHGYGSSGQTDTAVNLRSILANEFELIAPTYDGSRPDMAMAILETTFQLLQSRSPIIVGTSLGGFFANALSRRFNAPSIIVNPSTKPSTSLHKYGEDAKSLASYERFEAQIDAQPHRPSRVVVLGSRDNVVDPRTNGLLLKDNTETVWLDMGHRIEPAFYGTIAALVRATAAQGT
jgi:predicted esterase YcpF (UPF0227 family)